MPQDASTLTIDDSPLALLSEALARKLGREGRSARIDPDADLIELGLIDSQALLDMILDVEASTGRMFNAEVLDFEGGVTLGRLAAAFMA